ncbi:hypothetical protein E5S69_20500 [Cupriavidus necator]|uniref:hypothetical protein n=1 Tax=Cupriavidus necator TaxID=106590 RepID=UPI00148FFF87|nr:hypothetical protein [Cupriavidus necator]NOV25886.1 hypothetical protein [Cupriavidus necator]
MQNTLPVVPAVRAPRGIVQISGEQVRGWESWTVSRNTYYQADTFRVKFAESLLTPERDAAWFSALTEGFVEVFGGFPLDPENYTETELDSLIYGRIDDIEYDPARRTIELIGRDLTAVFIDAKTSLQFQNLTSSQIAIKLAESHGLTADVTPTKELVGTYYARDHARMVEERSEWDLLTYLASNEGYLCYVKGKTLYFHPRPTDQGDPYVIRWEPPTDDRAARQANVQEMEFSRSLTVAKGVSVVVRSWNAKQKQGFTAYYPSKGKTIQAGKAVPFGGVQVYSFVFPGLTQDQATQKAIELHREITSHEMKFWARMPADNILDPTMMIQVEGTGTKFDQAYYPVSVTRQMSLSTGYSMRVEAKNSNPETVPSP